MSENWRSEWSRHYDQVQWTGTSILFGVIGGLFLYCFEKTKTDFRPLVGLLGVWLTWLAIYLMASCRELRKLLHGDMADNEEKRFLQDKAGKRFLRQGRAVLLTFLLLIVGWLWLFCRSEFYGLALALFTISIVGIPLVWSRADLRGGKPSPPDQPSARIQPPKEGPPASKGS